jgi:predicted HTH domain antitoxin
MATRTVSTRLETEELRQLETLAHSSDLDRSTLVRTLLRRGMREIRMEQAVEAYRAETVTLGRAAEMAGVGTWDFLALMANHDLELHYGVEDLEADLANVE